MLHRTSFQSRSHRTGTHSWALAASVKAPFMSGPCLIGGQSRSRTDTKVQPLYFVFLISSRNQIPASPVIQSKTAPAGPEKGLPWNLPHLFRCEWFRLAKSDAFPPTRPD